MLYAAGDGLAAVFRGVACGMRDAAFYGLDEAELLLRLGRGEAWRLVETGEMYAEYLGGRLAVPPGEISRLSGAPAPDPGPFAGFRRPRWALAAEAAFPGPAGGDYAAFERPLESFGAYRAVSERTRGLLRRRGVRTPNDLRFLRRGDLMGMRGFGAGCLSEVERFLERLGTGLAVSERAPGAQLLSEAPPEPEDLLLEGLVRRAEARRAVQLWDSGDEVGRLVGRVLGRVEEELAAGSLDGEALLTWPPLRWVAHDLCGGPYGARAGIGGLAGVLERAERAAGRGFVRGLSPVLVALEEGLRERIVEGELRALWAEGPERERAAFGRRYGPEVPPFAVLAGELGVSAERTRQLVLSGASRFARAFWRAPAPRLRTAFALSSRAAGPEELLSLLRERGLAESPGAAEEVGALWRAGVPAVPGGPAMPAYFGGGKGAPSWDLGARPAEPDGTAGGASGSCSTETPLSNDRKASLVRRISGEVRRVGCVGAAALLAEEALRPGPQPTRGQLEDLLRSRGFDEASGGSAGYWFPRVGGASQLRGVALRALAARGDASVGQLHRDAIYSNLSGLRRPPPEAVLRELLERHPDFDVSPDGTVSISREAQVFGGSSARGARPGGGGPRARDRGAPAC